MRRSTTTARTATAVAAIVLLASLTACTPAAPSACPPRFLETVNEAAEEQGLGITFSPATPSDMRPAELRGWFDGACVVAFTGALPGGTAAGHFAFSTTELDGPAFSLAVQELGYEGENGTWSRTPADADPEREADVISATTPSGGGSLVDLDEAFPDAKSVVSSFRFTLD